MGHEGRDGAFKAAGTGFLYGHPAGIDPADGQQWFRVFLVTNHHVIKSADSIVARFNLSANPASRLIPLSVPHGNSLTRWTVHPDGADVAVIPISASALEKEGIEFAVFQRDSNILFRQQVREYGIGEGNGVFALGFPLGLAGDERNYVIVRQGIVARIQDWLAGDEDTFLIDSSVFPGNSGGPVLTKPEVVQISNTQSFIRCCLIGMVSSYLPYKDVAISLQTNNPRVIFEENSGIGVVIPSDKIGETINAALENALPDEQDPTEPRAKAD